MSKFLGNLMPQLCRPWLWLSQPLSRDTLNSNPYVEFAKWVGLARRCFWLEFPEAMCLATVDSAGRPDSRMVLMRGFSPLGIVFYTNYGSAKGKQIDFNNSGSLTFFWDGLQRQIRVRGKLEKLGQAESDAYFYSRPLGSRVAAFLSKQSHNLEDSAEFHDKLRDSQKSLLGKSGVELEKLLPRPDCWGGYSLKAEEFEFWKARSHRAHDRFLYFRAQDKWQIDQLYP